jgi:hypothetical protein
MRIREEQMFDVIEECDNQLRDRLLKDFVRVIARLRGADDLAQRSVGHSINIANSLFIQRFGSAEKFQASSDEKKRQYIGNLARAEERFAGRWSTMAVGFSLFKMWLEALVEEDEALVRHLSSCLTALSAKSGEAAYYSFAMANSRPARAQAAATIAPQPT